MSSDVSEISRFIIPGRHHRNCRDFKEGRKLTVGGAKPKSCVEVIMTELL